ncbi:copper homeostasis membrane protein CopD [Jiella sp. M17.18]|uniref:copper homeostasis membrane protein CopD n=1 Tax=Jiella sp. M17.18 TaxID=3234247 RepID=UPI0034DFE703
MARSVDRRPQVQRQLPLHGEALIGPEAVLAAERLVRDVALLGLWGGSAFLAALVPRDLSMRIAAGLGPARRAAIAVVLAATALALPCQTAMIGDGWRDALSGSMLGAVLFETSVGAAWAAEAAAVLLLVATLALPSRLAPAGTAAASALALAALTLTGHAQMHEGWLGALHKANEALHLLSAGAWLGALVPLLLILRRLGDPACRGDAVVALRRFSEAGHAAVALIFLTGLLNSWLILGGLPLDRAAPYQVLLSVKIVLVVAMALLAILNRYAIVPRLRQDPERSLQTIRTITLAEIGLGTAAITLVAVFGLMEPMPS